MVSRGPSGPRSEEVKHNAATWARAAARIHSFRRAAVRHAVGRSGADRHGRDFWSRDRSDRRCAAWRHDHRDQRDHRAGTNGRHQRDRALSGLRPPAEPLLSEGGAAGLLDCHTSGINRERRRCCGHQHLDGCRQHLGNGDRQRRVAASGEQENGSEQRRLAGNAREPAQPIPPVPRLHAADAGNVREHEHVGAGHGIEHRRRARERVVAARRRVLQPRRGLREGQAAIQRGLDPDPPLPRRQYRSPPGPSQRSCCSPSGSRCWG